MHTNTLSYCFCLQVYDCFVGPVGQPGCARQCSFCAPPVLLGFNSEGEFRPPEITTGSDGLFWDDRLKGTRHFLTLSVWISSFIWPIISGFLVDKLFPFFNLTKYFIWVFIWQIISVSVRNHSRKHLIILRWQNIVDITLSFTLNLCQRFGKQIICFLVVSPLFVPCRFQCDYVAIICNGNIGIRLNCVDNCFLTSHQGCGQVPVLVLVLKYNFVSTWCTWVLDWQKCKVLVLDPKYLIKIKYFSSTVEPLICIYCWLFRELFAAVIM